MRATFLFKKGDLNSSQAVLNGLSADVKKTPLLLKLQGLIYVKSGDYASAVSVYETRYEVIPGLDTAKELSSAYALNGQQQEAIDFLVSVIEKYPNKAKTLELKLASLLTSLDPTEAIERYETIITREPSNYLALNNLAWLLLEADKVDEAMMYAEQAYEYGGKRPQIADTYGYILLKGGETEKANDILKLVYADLKANPEVGLHYAESLIENNQINEAKTVLSKVVTEDLKLLELKGILENRLGN
ncbi:tetratricopeptide repeat protein [Vibrio algarum]|uniref:Tetratricopeptide repeat protein n=1 Tax=Vibrio algarum TaxID=3020714 RepID=A0ABT4YQ78_9VIBR|nr:tetratricopeptide repeat protein [Vibrio sp. KJ40-1]MDB1123702.1 tetratricopeptide repeat protein [Vibrio sp. KJ40-1]